MDLEEFIKQTLVSTAKAVVSANSELKKKEEFKHCSFRMKNNEVVKFDVAVTTTNSSADGLGGKISVVGVSAGAKTELNKTDERTSRIQFWIEVENYIA